jgi:hypothetical protein
MRTRRIVCVVGLLTCLLAGAFTFSPVASATQDVVGKWVNDKGNWIEFFEDQTYAAKSGDMNVAGKWIRLQDGRVKMELLLFEVIEIIMGDVKDDVMTTNFNGKIATWRMVIK